MLQVNYNKLREISKDNIQKKLRDEDDNEEIITLFDSEKKFVVRKGIPYLIDKKGGVFPLTDKEFFVASVGYSEPHDGFVKEAVFEDLNYQKRTLYIPEEIVLDKKQTLAFLAKNGLGSNNCNKEIWQYLKNSTPKARVKIVSLSGWKDNDDYVCPSFVIQKSSGPTLRSVIEEEISPDATLDRWKRGLGKYLKNNSVLAISTYSALLGPLLKFLPAVGSVAINLTGGSSIGKTTALNFASSLWGSPRKFKKQWRSTANALEAVAESRNDSLLVLDELGQVSAKDFSNVVYMLGNEKGKSRLTADARLKKAKEWRLSILSSGEIGLNDKLAEDGQKAKGGQAVRFIDVEAQVSESQGIFEDLHDCEDGAELSKRINENCEKYCGVAAKEFVKRLAAMENKEEEIRKIYNKSFSLFKETFRKEYDDSPCFGRIAGVFAGLSAAGTLASKDFFEITDQTAREVENSVIKTIKRISDDGENVSLQKEEKIIEELKSYITKNEARFQNADPNSRERISGDIFGYREFKTSEDDNCVTESATYYLNPAVPFKNTFSFHFKLVKKILNDKGIMILDKEGKNPKIRREIVFNCPRMFTFNFKDIDDSSKSSRRTLSS